MERQERKMRKLKYAAVLLLTVLLVLAGAFLPDFSSHFTYQDEKVRYENIEPLELERPQLERQNRSLTEKLSILQYDGQIVNVDEKIMLSKQSEIRRAVEGYVERCIAAGAMPADTKIGETVKIVPCAIFDYKNGETYDFFWNINLTLDSSRGPIGIFGTMDDATHHMFRFNISDYLGDPSDDHEPVPGRKKKFAEFYFRELGIRPEPVPSQDESLLQYRLDMGKDSSFLFEFYDYGNGINLYIA